MRVAATRGPFDSEWCVEDLAERFRIPSGTGAPDQIFRAPDSLRKALL